MSSQALDQLIEAFVLVLLAHIKTQPSIAQYYTIKYTHADALAISKFLLVSTNIMHLKYNSHYILQGCN